MKQKPQLVLVDTNVLVSALIAPHGLQNQLVTLLTKDKRFQLLIPEEQWKELVSVLEYPRIAKKYSIKKRQLDHLISFLEKQKPVTLVAPLDLRDPKDNMFLDAAVGWHASYLISGDGDLLILKKFKMTKIVSPREFIDRFFSSQSLPLP